MMVRRPSLIVGLLVGVALLFAVTGVFAASYAFSGTIASGPQYDLYSINLIGGESVDATVYCADPPNNTLDTIVSVYFPGSDPSSTANADVYNDDGGSQLCGGFHNSHLAFGAPVTGVYVFRVDGFGSATGDYTLNIVTGGGNPMAADGRINPQQDAPVVLYCSGDSVNVFSVTGQMQGSVANGGTGTFGAAVVQPTADGRMEVSAGLPDGKTYLYIWDGCGMKGHYEAYSVYNGVPSLYDSGSY